MDNLDVESALDTRRDEDKNNKTKKTTQKTTLQTPPKEKKPQHIKLKKMTPLKTPQLNQGAREE
jgi:hypothetical protein